MEWQPIETAPKDEFVLCWNPNKNFPRIGGVIVEAGAAPGLSIDYPTRPNITHWMPLPPPPKPSSDSGD